MKSRASILEYSFSVYVSALNVEKMKVEKH